LSKVSVPLQTIRALSTWPRIEWSSAKYWPALASYRTVIKALMRENEYLEALDE
jgi:hypothetical protein